MLNNGTALIFFIMYYELSERTLDDDQPKGLWMILSALIVLMMFAEFVLSMLVLNTLIS
jgi:hypothetical protein